MLSTVKLDENFSNKTNKLDDELSDRGLLAKLESTKLAIVGRFDQSSRSFSVKFFLSSRASL